MCGMAGGDGCGFRESRCGVKADTFVSIDPGPILSAWVIFRNGKPSNFGKDENTDLLQFCLAWRCEELMVVIEQIEAMGMAVGKEVFETVFWSGRFAQASYAWDRVTRREVKLHLCGSMRAKDANVRQALIDKFGGESAIGRKKAPGVLYGVSGDVWSALAVGLTWIETHAAQHV